MNHYAKSALVAAMLIAGGQLAAQPAGAPQPGPADGAAAVSRADKLTPAQMAKEGETMAAGVAAALLHVQHLQATARREKDVIKLNCVNDKYVEIKGAANVFDDRHASLTDALETDQRGASFDALAASAAEIQKFKEEADQCVGKGELLTSESDSTRPDFQDDPTAGLPFDEPSTAGVEAPAYASPFD